MKQIPLQVLDGYRQQVRNTALLVKVVETGGQVHGFCSKDLQIVFNDGVHTVAYSPAQELRPQNMLNVSTMEVDNTEMAGWFAPAIEQRVRAGRFNGATIVVYRVLVNNTAAGCEIVNSGRVGKINWSAGEVTKRKLEFRSLTHLLRYAVNEQWSLTCRNEFGDPDCGMPLVWSAGTVVEVADPRMRFRLGGVTAADGFYTFGLVEFVDGDNATFTMEVEEWGADGWVKLSYVTPYQVPVGAAVRIRQDCDKRAETCKSYGNIPRMKAEHLTPVQEQALMVPGAYIKSDNAL